MKNVLISTTNFHNCGDDFIREGLLKLLDFKNDINLIWWNRGPGINPKYANDLSINLKLMEYFIVAGSPTYIYRHEIIYKYCIKNNIPFSIIGVGTKGGMHKQSQKTLMQKVAKSNLCEIVLVRDNIAKNNLEKLGFKNVGIMIDPAFFNINNKKPKNKTNIITWRNFGYNKYSNAYLKEFFNNLYRFPINNLKKIISNLFFNNKDNSKINKYNYRLHKIFKNMSMPKKIIVHENHELLVAEKLFGKENVLYSSDYRRLYSYYNTPKLFIGSRIHGAIPTIINGGATNLIYNSSKSSVINTSLSLLKKNYPNITNCVKIFNISDDYINNLTYNQIDKFALINAIELEENRIRLLVKSTNYLSKLIKLKNA